MRFYYMTVTPKDGDENVAILAMRTNVNDLPATPWKFLGWEKTSRRAVRAAKEDWLKFINDAYGKQFTELLIV